jgi:heme oxygenase
MTPASGGELAVVPLPAQQIQEQLANLRRHTAPYHLAVERRVDIVGRLGSPDRYATLLARLYGFYEPFEAELDRAVARWGLRFDVEARRKAPLLARDLAALDVAPAAVDGLPRSARIPRPTNPLAALGCLYVLEGATLGGRLIARHVTQRLGFGPYSGASFFHGYGSAAGPRWRTFCSVLAAETCSGVAERAILSGAIDTFVAYDRWLADDDASSFPARGTGEDRRPEAWASSNQA